MVRLAFILILSFLVISGLTILIGKVVKKNRIIKYVPSIVFLVLALYNLYLSKTVTTGFEDLARLLVAMILFSAFLGGLVTGLFMDYILPKLNKR